jgi:PKD repeat protein
MSDLPLSRRAYVRALAALGVLGSVAGTAAGADGQVRGTQRDGLTGGGDRVLGAKLINLETGDARGVSDLSKVDRGSLDPGEYEIVVFTRSGEGVSERRHRVSVSRDVSTANTHRELRVLVPDGPRGSYPTGEPVPIWAGVVDGDGRPVAGVDFEVSVVTDGSSDEVASYDVTTNSGGNASVEFVPDERGSYRVEVDSEEVDGFSRDSFDVGPNTSVLTDTGVAAPGTETTIGISSLFNGGAEDGASRTVEISGPSGTGTDTVTIDGGTALLDVELPTEGTYVYSLDGASSSTSAAGTIKVDSLRLCPPEDTYWNQYVGEQGTFAGIIFDDDDPAADEDVTIRFVSSREDDVIVETSTTTDGMGAFLAEYTIPPGLDDFTFVDIEMLVNGEEIRIARDVTFRRIPGQGSGTGTELDITYDTSRTRVGASGVVPGADVEVTATLMNEGESVPNTDVTLRYGFKFFDGVPLGAADLVTDADGEATTTVSVPDDAPDGERFRVGGEAEVGGETVTDRRTRPIYHLNSGLPDDWLGGSLGPGGSADVEWRVTDMATDEPVSDARTVMFSRRNVLDAEVFDAASLTTDTNGTAAGSLDIPADATSRVAISNRWMYRGGVTTRTIDFDPLDLQVSVDPEEPVPGETITVEYGTGATAETRARIVFPKLRETNQGVATEADGVELDVPWWLDPGDREYITVLAVSEDGRKSEQIIGIDLAEVLAPGFTFEPRVPDPGEEVTFTDGTRTSGTTVVDREWDLDGDGSTDESGNLVTYTYDTAGAYPVSLTVTDDAGDTATLTRVVPVGVDEELVAAFGYQPANTVVEEPVTFTDRSSPGDAEIVSHEWDLTGDGAVDATGETVTRTYDQSGEYDVTLTVTDADGGTDEMTQTLTVTLEPPEASFSIDPADPAVEETVTFTDGSSPGAAEIVSYEWDLTGDGAVDATGETVTRTYDQPGEYDVTLTVTDAEGQSDTAAKTLTVRPDGPPALPGQDNPPRDLDGDGRFEDVTGEGEFSVSDVQVFFEHYQSDVVQNNATFFNFAEDDPPDVSIGDVQALFQLYQEQ